MKRYSWPTLTVALALLAVAVRADVKTTEKTTLKIEGFLGGLLSRMGGGADGITSTVALHGSRMARMNATNGQIVDLAEQKVFTIDVKKKEYQVLTFAQMRAELEKVKADMEKQAASMKPEEKQKAGEAAKQLEMDADVKETGQKKSLLGHEAREVILTITLREKGRKLEDSGGMVMTNTMWIAPKVAELDELMAFNLKFFDAVYGGIFGSGDPRQMVSLSALLPGFGSLMEKMQGEAKKLQGTPLATSTLIETVKSAEQMKAISEQSQSGGGGGGLGGLLAGKLGGKGATEPRTKTMTSTQEDLSIATAASADDVAIPAGFKEKK